MSTSSITIKKFSNVEQGRLDDLFRPNTTYCTITPTIYYLVGRVAGMGTLYNSPITTNSISCIVRVNVSGIFRPISTSTIFNSDVTLIIFMKRLLYRTWRYWWIWKYTTVALVMGEIMAGMRPISTSPFNIKYCSPIERGRVSGVLWPRSTSTNISYMITIGRVDGLKIPMSTTSVITGGRVDGFKRPMPTSSLTQSHS